MPRKPELEAALETRCVARIENLGGLALKLRPPTGRGFPDRTIFLNGKTIFVEFKRPKIGRASVQQHTWSDDLSVAGFTVYLIDNDADFEAVLSYEGAI